MNQHQAVWINPYKKIVGDFPGTLFPFMDEGFERGLLRKRCSAHNEIYVEIGSGSGHHLITLAQRKPNALVIGIELRYKRAVRTVQKAQKASLSNLIVLRTNARSVNELFPPSSLSGVYVNFPDPWQKIKRRKNRVLSPDFFNHISELLKSDGFISFKTDHREYFESTLEHQAIYNHFSLAEKTSDLYRSEYLKDNISTEFEMLFHHKGLPINYALFNKA